MEITHCKSCESLLDRDGSCPKCLMMVGLDSELLESEVFPLEIAEDRIAGYQITGTIGRGGMGTVFAARHLHLDREVAVKLLAPDGVSGQDFADRFRREARTMASLAHPNVVAIHDFGQDDEFCWLVMERIDGVNLRELMSQELTSEQAMDIVRQVCDALHYAHQQGVVHRDIKPENILVDRTGRVKLGDFGLAKLLHQGTFATRLTGSRHVMGTPLYMAPEQVNAPLDVDHRADIYALGVVLYELLTGTLPVGRFEPPSAAGRGDQRLDGVVLKALEHTPAERYQQISDIRRDLDSALAGVLVSPAPGAPAVAAPVPDQPVASSGRSIGFSTSSPLWLSWWEIILCGMTALACFMPWEVRSSYMGSGGPDPWARVAGLLMGAPVAWVAIGYRWLRAPLPWVTLASSAFALIMMSGAVVSSAFWTPGPAPFVAFIGAGVVAAASCVRLVRAGTFPWLSWALIPLRTAKGRVHVLICALVLFSVPLVGETWDYSGARDYSGGWSKPPNFGYTTMAGIQALGFALGLPVLLVASAGRRSRWWGGAVSFGSGTALASVTLFWATRPERVDVQAPPLLLGSVGVTVAILGILLLSWAYQERAEEKRTR